MNICDDFQGKSSIISRNTFNFLYGKIKGTPLIFFTEIKSQFHRMIDSMLEGTSEDQLAQYFVANGAYMRLSSTISNRILKTSSDWDATTSLGRFFQ